MIKIDIPQIMAHLEKDSRGYPIPYTIYRDIDNKPHFTINDELKRRVCIKKDLCSICGNNLFRGRWFVGGPRSAFDPHGCYIDTPLHTQCMEYAMKVCPYLAAPKYTKRIDDSTLDKSKIEKNRIFIDNTQDDNRPDFFVAVLTRGQRIINNGEYLRPIKPYISVKYWKNGKQAGNIRELIMELISDQRTEVSINSE